MLHKFWCNTNSWWSYRGRCDADRDESGSTTENLFTGEALAAGQGGILGVIFAVWLLSIVEKNCIK